MRICLHGNSRRIGNKRKKKLELFNKMGFVPKFNLPEES